MRQKTRLIPSPAMLVALVALVVAMSGAAIALPGKAQVKKDDIAKGAVTAKAIARNAVRGKQVAANAVTGVKVKDESLSSKDVSDYGVISSGAGNFVKLTATLATSEALGRTAAPATVLFKKGTITISAKCFRDTTADQTFGEVYIATSANGAIFDGSTDELGGGPLATDFLNTNTVDTDRQLETISVLGATAAIDESEFAIIGPDGTHLLGQLTTAAKNGTLPGGNGAYGAGSVCLFGGEFSG